MDQITRIDKDVNIVAYYFHNKGPRLRCFPRVMEWGSRRVSFTQTGLVHPTKKGQRTIHVFDMTDGNADYRLEFDAQTLSWTLVSVADVNLSSQNAKIVPSAAAA